MQIYVPCDQKKKWWQLREHDYEIVHDVGWPTVLCKRCMFWKQW